MDFVFHIFCFKIGNIVIFRSECGGIFSEICLLVEFSRQKDYFAGEIENDTWMDHQNIHFQVFHHHF